MGLLEELGAWLDQKKKNVATNARDLPGLLASLSQDVQQGAAADKSAFDASRSVMPSVRDAGVREMNARGQELGGLLGAIKVFHGSPHKFDKFDFSKIGTGEGAQAYGHGGYFAESKNVAQEYADKLDPSRWENAYTVGGKPITPHDKDWTMAQTIASKGREVAIKEQSDSIASAIAKVGESSPVVAAKKRVLQRMIDFPEVKDVGRLVGSKQMYEANLRWPDAAREAADPLGPQHFLDWDKPLSEQPKSVQAALEKIGVKQPSKELIDEAAAQVLDAAKRGDSAALGQSQRDWTLLAYPRKGSEIYREFPTDRRASEVMSGAGIPGIRYLDGGSRAAGQGTANYVVFDDALTEILKRNGEPVQGLLKREPTKFELAHAEAQRNAALPAKKKGLIADWKWRSPDTVKQEVGVDAVPDYIADNYGKFMQEQNAKAAAGELGARDLLKAYGITRSSVNRGAREISDDLAQGTARPEGYFAEWLLSPQGKAYLDAAEKGQIDASAIADIQKRFAPFGMADTLASDLAYAAKELPKINGSVNAAVTGPVESWRELAQSLNGIGPSKSGFIASLLGRGDLPTFDARQIALHTGKPAKEASKFIRRGGGAGGDAAVDRLAKRQKDMGLKVPPELDPFYQHLTHHTIWDKVGGTQTTHEDLIRAMKLAGFGGMGLLGAGAYGDEQ